MFVRASLLSLALVLGAVAGPSGRTAAGSAPTSTAVTAVSDASVPEAPSGLRLLTRRGQSVTLGWTAPANGPAVIGYIIEGGLAPSEVLGSVPTAGTATVFTFDAPVGAFFVRVHAVGENGKSGASNEIPLVVSGATVPAPPSAPASLLGLAQGTTLALSWTPTLDGGDAVRQWLQVTGSLSGTLPVPAGETFRVDGVPPGTYSFRLIAENDAGPSAPSNEVTLSFPATCSAAPNPPTAFRAWQVGAMVSIAWDPPQSGPAVERYTVHVEGDLRLSFDTTERLVSAPLPAGQFAVRVEAVNACGRSLGAPSAPDWTTATRDTTSHAVHFGARPGVSYRVFWSASKADLDPLAPGLPFVDTDVSPVRLPLDAPASPRYYRVFTVDGPLVTGGGRITTPPAFDVTDHTSWPGNITPALWDIDGDGCLDLIGGRGRCDGTFETYPLGPVGLDGFTADGPRKDSRFADFTGDGITDIFTNVYAAASVTWAKSVLHVGTLQGTFTVDPDMTALDVDGWGETILAADFDNDGDLDIFNPAYTHRGDGGHNWLLINDGSGRFTDVSSSAGLAINAHEPPEAAQALDYDDDGWLDIHVGSQLFRNNGDLTFTDIATTLQHPIEFDEGMRLFDADHDGDLDLVHNNSFLTRFHRNDAGTFDTGVIVDGNEAGDTYGYGLNVCDVNGDGFEDVIVPSNDRTTTVGLPRLLVNAGGVLVPSEIEAGTPVANDLLACADLDRSGTPDIVSRWTVGGMSSFNLPVRLVQMRTLRNRESATDVITLRIVDAQGRRNQQGRTVRLRPRAVPGRTLLRAVESGSGYLSQNGYDLLVAAPWPGEYDVEVRYAAGVVRTTARPGDVLTIRADGTVLPGLQ